MFVVHARRSQSPILQALLAASSSRAKNPACQLKFINTTKILMLTKAAKWNRTVLEVLYQIGSTTHVADLNHCQVSLVDVASAATNETKLSSAAEVHSSRSPQPAAVNALLAQSSQHLQAGTAGPPADSTTNQHITCLKLIWVWTSTIRR